jgi:hypothetical protein
MHGFSFTALLAGLCLSFSACAQPGPPVVFAGSTPCDSAIRSVMQIPQSTICEFMKWEMKFLSNPAEPGRFELTVSYGQSKPNTNGFMNGGEKLILNGTYTIQSTKSTAVRKIYLLKSEKLSEPVVLIRMDNNIFHFADRHQKLLVGNGGWGYVLNRLNE